MRRVVKTFVGMLWAGTMLYAVPAAPGTHTFKQPDGTVFEGKIRGDEWLGWIEDSSGRVILYNRAEKRYEYAKIREGKSGAELVPSGVAVGDRNAREAQAAGTVDRAALKRIWERKRKEAVRVLQHRR